jgi:hypothetical protein
MFGSENHGYDLKDGDLVSRKALARKAPTTVAKRRSAFAASMIKKFSTGRKTIILSSSLICVYFISRFFYNKSFA